MQTEQSYCTEQETNGSNSTSTRELGRKHSKSPLSRRTCVCVCGEIKVHKHLSVLTMPGHLKEVTKSNECWDIAQKVN